MFSHEYFYSSARGQGRGYHNNVSIQPRAIQATTYLLIFSTVGGMLMFLAGLFYLAFEQTISKGSGHPISVAGSRIIMGIQVFREALDI